MCANLNSITGHRKYTVQEYLLLEVLKKSSLNRVFSLIITELRSSICRSITITFIWVLVFENTFSPNHFKNFITENFKLKWLICNYVSLLYISAYIYPLGQFKGQS